MKKILTLLLAIIALVSLSGCSSNVPLLRVHIRANSNDTGDQSVKLEVRDSVVAYLEPLMSEITSLEVAIAKLDSELANIINVANVALTKKGFSYTAKAYVTNEFFPTRTYEGNVVDSGYYDALIIELGEAKGDNWWCVIYPPLCFVERTGNDFAYASKIAELFDKYFK